jgi:low affinity Fe/Cu permease
VAARITQANRIFTKLAIWCGNSFGSPLNFGLWVVIITIWLVAGKSLHYSDTWQLLINTPTTIIELFAAILIQYVGNRIERRQQDHEAVMLKMLDHIETMLDNNSENDKSNIEELASNRFDI